ncbi:MAG: tRNA (adenosine(37)-N6)-dimethylallyltransferase MiaA [Paracoccaceae bacterium]
MNDLPIIRPDATILIAGATASGKSALALRIAEQYGGVIVNADASQVFDCWRVVTARPSVIDEKRAPHLLYGHLPYDSPYSTGHWLRELTPLLNGPDRLIIVGGTGLNFTALTKGLADIPLVPNQIREDGNTLALSELIVQTDPATLARIDTNNRARVQRAWEVERATGRPLHDWQDNTGPPLLPLDETVPIVVDVPKPTLDTRIAQRFDIMIEEGALDEVKKMQSMYDPRLPAFKAIGVPDLMDHLTIGTSLEVACKSAVTATRQFAKRQRTWMRSKMQDWHWVST